jgi:hypothetical protein
MSRLARNKRRIGSSPDVLSRLARAGRVSLDWLVDGTGPIELPRGLLPGELPIMRAHTDWGRELPIAKTAHRSMPEKGWQLVAEAMIPEDVAYDAVLIAGMARELYDAWERKEATKRQEMKAAHTDRAREAEAEEEPPPSRTRSGNQPAQRLRKRG